MSDYGFDALRLSVAGAWRLFGPDARYVVCVNSVAAHEARRRVGSVSAEVEWKPVSATDVPPFVRTRLDAQFAEGTGWKFAPLRLADDLFELSLDNDCILWDVPEGLAAWLSGVDNRALVAADVRACFGAFSAHCGGEPRNGGIRGLPPAFPFADELQALLRRHPGLLTSELDEQGLQVAALSRLGAPHVVTTSEVTICSPFHPHQPHLGTCGAHFVGLNATRLPWSYYGRPALEMVREHWEARRVEVEARVGLKYEPSSQ